MDTPQLDDDIILLKHNGIDWVVKNMGELIPNVFIVRTKNSGDITVQKSHYEGYEWEEINYLFEVVKE